ncbi:MAG: hypothetical protein V2I33_01930 [Kangiellaceae bacterium]|jgi:protein-S-isoprenylcysteine O-methyltransferase Ste14|nr:hypothetical protein [Kangiellaceae bacterium]
MNSITRPDSVQSNLSNIAGILGFSIAFSLLKTSSLATIDKLLIILLSLCLPIIVIDLLVYKVFKRDSTGLDFSQPFAPSITRILTKLIGFAGVLLLIAAAYLSFPVYQRSAYSEYWLFLDTVYLTAAVTIPLYFIVIDGFSRETKDGYWHFGRLLLLGSDTDKEKIKQFLLGWLIKGFFLALMVPALMQNIEAWQNLKYNFTMAASGQLVAIIFNALYSIDLAFIICGYVLTCRLFDSHIRSAEPTFFGWGITLICYQPIWNFIYSRYLRYDQGLDWQQWLSGVPWAYIIWAIIILSLTFIYAWSSTCFGLRFSNLTNRGIITHGPYRWVKHPAYLSKNLSWWFISIPFINFDSSIDAIQQCVFLLGVNTIYYWRAVTEERHLSHDPTYRQYAKYIEQEGLFAQIKRRFAK